jgi:CO/xanthine dehydrogenase Mo-binding subunit
MALDDRHEAEGRVFKVVGTRPIRPDGVDKVTGRARFGADMNAPGMLVGLVLRSPHAHARIRGIDTAKARALPGVKAVVTSADFADVSANISGDLRDTLHNVMAHGKALYDGHAVAAVAATSASVAKQALKLIAVDYEVLPHVTDVDEAMKPDAPVLHEGRSDETVPQGMSGNVMHRFEYGHGDVEAGFAEADEVIERCFKTAATHQGYIEPHACLASMGPDGQADLWCCTQGHYMVRNTCAGLLGMDVSQLKVTASEIGGGFGAGGAGAVAHLGPSGENGDDPRRGAARLGADLVDLNGREDRHEAQSSPVQFGAMACFAAYDLKNVQAIGWDVVANRPKAAAYRAPGAPMGTYVVESVIDELCDKLGLDKVDVRLKNASRDGTKAAYGPRFGKIGLTATLEAAKAHPHWTAPLGPNQGRGLACGFWFNFGGDTCVTLNVNADGTVGVSEGNPDIGGSRASMTMMAAEELGIPYERVRTTIADTSALGQNEVTDGSRVTFAVGLATIKAARDAIQKMCARAAKIWDIDPDAVVWEDGHAKPAGPNAGKFPPMSLAEIAAVYANTGGPIAGHHEVTAEGAGVSFATHMVDAEVDPETGAVKIIRYTVFQDAGKAVHPAYVEGQFQGGAAQGIGWALNEEYIYGSDGRLQNPGFLDYRIPVASDLPMIDTVIVEVPNPGHPYGVRGVGETSIVPPLAAISNAVSAAAGVRMTELPMSPPVVLKAIGAARS